MSGSLHSGLLSVKLFFLRGFDKRSVPAEPTFDVQQRHLVFLVIPSGGALLSQDSMQGFQLRVASPRGLRVFSIKLSAEYQVLHLFFIDYNICCQNWHAVLLIYYF